MDTGHQENPQILGVFDDDPEKKYCNISIFIEFLSSLEQEE